MKTAFDGFENKVLTFEVDEKLEPGCPVKPAAGHKVEAAENGEDFFGIVVDCDGSFAGVCVRGVVEIKCSESQLGPGFEGLVATGDGKVCTGMGITRVILDNDSAAKTVTVML